MNENNLAEKHTGELRTVDSVTLEIKTLHKQAQQLMLSYAIEIGRRLVEVKDMLPHGTWGFYLKEQVEYSHSTANNFMRIFEEYGAPQQSIFGPEAKSQTLGNLPYTKALTLLALPQEEREEFVEKHDVEAMSSRELKKAIEERDQAISESEEAKEASEYKSELDRQKQIADEKATQADEKVKKADEELIALRKELEELQNAPESVAVETVVDEEAVQEAANTAREETEKKLKALIEQSEQSKKDAEQAKATAEQELSALKVQQEEADSIARKEKEAMAEEVKNLQKKLAVASSSEIAIFKLHFEQGQSSINNMTECIKKMAEAGDTEGATKLKNALSTLLNTTLSSLN